MNRREALVALAAAGELTVERARIVRTYQEEAVQRLLLEWLPSAAQLLWTTVTERDEDLTDEVIQRAVDAHMSWRGLDPAPIVWAPSRAWADHAYYDPRWEAPLVGITDELLAHVGFSTRILRLAHVEGSAWDPLRWLVEDGVWPYGLRRDEGNFVVYSVTEQDAHPRR